MCVCVCAALHPGPDAGKMDAPGPTDHPVLPGGIRLLRWLHPGVRLQAPLERRSDWSAAGGAHRCAQRESNCRN